ncbi:SprT-like family-domain-containing protein [Truncatella angustata]|uniref:SprT-like family-domain-containing protein n=1 Tax=Truncatella angustata TaxID=152316 RepID=A0A9P8UH45_9PEZI|nr:SprT-like family-domain-containing protein [Truncatella angustata]KAH6652076.1 SprT-like family-domain-containing protein [Truncatella angustata]KAH8195770.1 hypothetical protein TruAng_010072 [Truncatella angustata]
MARLLYESNSEDEFPPLKVVAKRVRQKMPAAKDTKPSITDKENVPSSEPPASLLGKSKLSELSFRGTPLRRRKLGDSQALDNPLFRKWSEDTAESRSRSSRVSSRETKRNTSDISICPSQELEDSTQESDDDVFVRRRIRAKPAAEKLVRKRAESRVKTEVLLSVTELSDNTRTTEETLEISAILSEGEELEGQGHSSNDDESEFVTALSENVESDSNYESPSESGSLTKPRRSKSPGTKSRGLVRLSPPKEPPKRQTQSNKSPAKDNKRAHSMDKTQTVPQTPGVRSRKSNPITESLGNDFQKLKLYADDLDNSPDAKPQTQLNPVTPKKSLQQSPFKATKIPPSPWKAEHKEFWDVEIQNEWVDQHSPPKRGPRKVDLMAGTSNIELLKKKYGASPEKRDAKKMFDQAKEKVAQEFLHELDERITTGQLSKLTEATGGLRIKWSTSLQTTAGRAHWKCKETTTNVQQPDGSFKSTRERRHEGFIELAAKVLSNEEDLLNTVAHEFCHLAVFMLNGKPKFAHGAEFKSWGSKCMDEFKDRGIEVTTKHNYEIDFKFIWRCSDCATEVKRHSKSVDPLKQRCGRCRGTLEQVKPVPRARGKGKSAYQEFVSTEMKVLKAEGRALSFKEMMATVSTRWKAHQETKRMETSTPGNDLKDLEVEFEELAVTDVISD